MDQSGCWRLWSLLLLASLSGAIMTLACNGPETTPEPTLPSVQELEQAAQDLLADIATANRAGDAAAYHQLLTSDIRERCSVEEVHRLLDPEEADTFAKLEVAAIYIDMEDFNRVWLRVSYQEETASIPIPMVWEDGRWRSSFPLHMADISDEGCPFNDIY